MAGEQVRVPKKIIHAQYVLPEHTQTSADVLDVIDNYAKTCVPRPSPQTDARERQLVQTWSLMVLVEHFRKSLASPPSLKVLEDETILSLLQTRIQETKELSQCLVACEHLQKLGSQRWKRMTMALFKASAFFYVRHSRINVKRSFCVQRTGTAVPSTEEEERKPEAQQGVKDTREVCDQVMRELASFFVVPELTEQTAVPVVSNREGVRKSQKTHKPQSSKPKKPAEKKKVEKGEKGKKASVSTQAASPSGSSGVQVSAIASPPAASSQPAPASPFQPVSNTEPFATASFCSVPVIPFSSQTAHLFSYPPSSPLSPFFPLFVAACRSAPSLSSPPPSGQ
eukprot:CAMPEP_0113880704 /NCGR_PEP_ID=MMETSP0780_2-20120614/7940_1 /TAXON_ID=652834 /ORGANISM="Palpitomonas bilix" /LENGTH=339 /DNA_ID=CAMNT_0000867423 /DNA_START=1802 /DNA_END=2821 /DNA_ORIENTATION=- /assembly_acc=CAM_ASM_000599